MTSYEVVNRTVIRRRRDPADVEAAAELRRRDRQPPTIAAEVKRDFRNLNQLGRRSRSTR